MILLLIIDNQNCIYFWFHYFLLTKYNLRFIFAKKIIGMRKSVLLMLVLLQVSLILEAKQKFTKEGIEVYSTYSNIQNSTESRSETISADITGHTLTITFNDNVGIAHIVIKDSNGVYIDRDNVFSTPDHATFIINDAGYYRMDITLSNGEQYYGYFRVEN